MDETSASLRYSHRPKPYSNELELELTSRALVASRGSSQQIYPLAHIEQLRFEFSPRNTSRLVFRALVRASDGKSVKFDSLSWKSLIQTDRQDAEYSRFVRELVRRAHVANPKVRLLAGIGPARYWLMLLAGVGIGFAILAAAVGAFNGGSWIVALGALGLLGYLGFWLREFLARNRPETFPPDTIPQRVLPP